MSTTTAFTDSDYDIGIKSSESQFRPPVASYNSKSA